MRRRCDRRTTVSLDLLENRSLLSSGVTTAVVEIASRPSAIFAKLEKAMKRDLKKEGRTPINKQIMREEVTIIQDDLYASGFFDAPVTSKRHHRARVDPAIDPTLTGQPPTESQILSQFQSDYQDAILDSAPDAGQLLVDDANLTLDTWDVISPLVLEGPAGVPEAIAELNEKTPDIYDDIDSILDNPLFESSPTVQNMVVAGQELGIDQASSGQPIELPTTPPIDGNAPPIETGPTAPSQAAISVNPDSLTFTATTGGSSPAPQTVTVTNSGTSGSMLEFVASASLSSPFPIQIEPSSANVAAGASTTLSVTVDPSGLAPGTYTSSIVISDLQSSNQYVTVPITLNVVPDIVGTYSGTYSGTAVKDVVGDGAYSVSGSISITITEVDPTPSGDYLIGTGQMAVPGYGTFSGSFQGDYNPSDGSLSSEIEDSSGNTVSFTDMNGNSSATMTSQAITGSLFAWIAEPDGSLFLTGNSSADTTTFTMTRSL